MGVWVRGLVVALGLVLMGCAQEYPSENENLAVISIYNTGNGWGYQHSWDIYENDTVGEISYSPELDFHLFDNGKRQVTGVVPGAFDAVRALMQEVDFNNMISLCREGRQGEFTGTTSDEGEMVMRLHENGSDVRVLEGCGTNNMVPLGQYNEQWRMLEQTIKGFVEQGAGRLDF